MKIPVTAPTPLTVVKVAPGGMVEETANSVIILELSGSVALTLKTRGEPTAAVIEDGTEIRGPRTMRKSTTFTVTVIE